MLGWVGWVKNGVWTWQGEKYAEYGLGIWSGRLGNWMDGLAKDRLNELYNFCY